MALMMLRMQSSGASPNFYKFPAEPNPAAASTPSSSSSSLPLQVLETIMSEPIIVDYGDSATKKATPHWLSPNYVDLHLRSARLVSCEVKIALDRHFERPRGRSVKKSGNGKPENHKGLNMPIVWDPSWEPALTMADAGVDDDRSFLDEAFC